MPAATLDTDPCHLERFCSYEGIYSGRLLPIISMMQATDQETGRIAGVFLQRVVDSVRVIIRDVTPDQTAQVNVIEDEQVIEKLSTTASDLPFCDSILPMK